MEKDIERATNEIVGNFPSGNEEKTLLTQCSIHIAIFALTALNGNLREKALNVAKAIADYEDSIKLKYG